MKLLEPNRKTLLCQAEDELALRIVMDGIIVNFPEKHIVRVSGVFGKDLGRHPLLDAG